MLIFLVNILSYVNGWEEGGSVKKKIDGYATKKKWWGSESLSYTFLNIEDNVDFKFGGGVYVSYC